MMDVRVAAKWGVVEGSGPLEAGEGEFDADVAVLGGGAAGLMAAIRAAEVGSRVIVLERNRRAGVKILMSGGTRCNITNARGLRRMDVVSGPVDPGYDPAQCRGTRAIQDAFGPGGPFLGPALRRFDVDQTVRLFESEGVSTKVEGNGKIFPASDRATDVLDALSRRLERSGAALRGHASVESIRPIDGEAGGFRIDLTDATIAARRVIVAMGGQSYPGCGTRGDGYRLAASLGHGLVALRPALVPIRVEPEWVASLRGLSLQDVVASIHLPGGKLLQERREAILFAHFGLSGPAILDISRAVAHHEGVEPLDLRLDLFPDQPREVLDARLQAACRQGKASVTSLISAMLPQRLAECLVEAAEIPRTRTGPELSRAERSRLVQALKGHPLRVAGTLGFEKAEVTTGGVRLDEVDPRTLQSRLVPGLYFAGEVLDLDGLIGGYNFQAAWSTGWLAGESAANSQGLRL
ncbi:NAD(P)/FAD-dependent oxidoreductase [Aquisphaera insulae]|uniref:NAD(P)/FAD-dependent oxidoreductase n=1 Tax=Aquisphaera insulae TaxID=2712864 RepID=UPI00203026FD|nr:NAD(P)/FAD-dependent oxidoreductase [Aquisphaera insulae]